MKKIKLLTLLMAAPMLWSCSAEDPMPPLTDATEIEDPNFVPLDEAIENADRILASAFGSKTRSSRNVKSVEFFGQNTRSSENAGSYGYYIVNYENDGGFALLSADRRLLPVYAFSDEGSLSIRDTIESEGLRAYMNTLPEINGDYKPYVPRDSFPLQIFDRLRIERGPLLHDNVRKRWKETSPFNQYCLIPSTGVPGRAGSAAVAIGMFLSYHKQPKSYKGKSYDWDGMIAGTKDSDVAHLFKSIGEQDNMNIEYGKSYSSCQFMNVLTTMRHFGYGRALGSSGTTEFISWIAACEMNYARDNLILVYGFDTIRNKYYMWIMDGYAATESTADIKDRSKRTYYLHCAWGNGGRNDGFYHYDESSESMGPDNRRYKNLVMSYGYKYNKYLD